MLYIFCILGHKEAEEKLHNIVNELHDQGINITIKWLLVEFIDC